MEKLANLLPGKKPQTGESKTGNSADSKAEKQPKPTTPTPSNEDVALAREQEEREYYERIRVSYEEKPGCPHCNDARWVRTGRWIQDGKGRRAEIVPCHCTRETPEEKEGRLMAHSGTPLGFMSCTFESFEPEKGLLEALSLAQSFAEGRLSCLVLSGPTGVGKTHLAIAAARRRAMRGQSPRFCFLNVPQLLKDIRATFGLKGETRESDLMGPAQDWPVAILDDLGAEYGTPWAAEEVYCIVDARYSKNLPTIVTTNVLPAQWEERVRSRLTDRRGSAVCMIAAGDYRAKKA